MLLKVQSKIPAQLTNTLDAAFDKAFQMVFEKGTGVIEKTFDKKKISYTHEMKERLYILNLVSAALSEEEDCRRRMKQAEKCLMEQIGPDWDLEQEIARTTKILSKKMLTAKFIQGLPVAGVLGGISNAAVYQRVIDFAMLKYKKRYFYELVKR